MVTSRPHSNVRTISIIQEPNYQHWSPNAFSCHNNKHACYVSSLLLSPQLCAPHGKYILRSTFDNNKSIAKSFNYVRRCSASVPSGSPCRCTPVQQPKAHRWPVCAAAACQETAVSAANQRKRARLECPMRAAAQ